MYIKKEMAKYFYDRLDTLLNEKGITLNYLSEQTDIGRNTIYQCRIRNTVPSIEILYQIAQYLDVTIDYLLHGSDLIERKIVQYLNSPEGHALIKQIMDQFTMK